MQSDSSGASHLTYLDFELEIQPGHGREYPVAVVRSPAGEAHETMRFPYDELTLENRLKDLQIALLRSGGKRRRVLSPEERAVQDFGRDMFDALLSGEVRSRYDVSLIKVDQQGKGLRLKLRIQSPKLAALPWEFLYDSRQAEFMCLSRNTPVVRYLELPQPIRPLAVTPPLRILGMIARPHGLPLLDAEREKQRVEAATEGLRTRGLVDLTWMPGQTWRDLQRAMRRGPWHIFHFIGHGGFDGSTDEGFIALAAGEDRIHHLRATMLGRLLADHRPLRLVLLNACEGARGSERDFFSGTATLLVRRGIPAVLAMQYEITDQAAVEFAQSFYEALADGMPVDAAVTEARKAISLAVTNTVEWGVPMLYMRSPDGVLFTIKRRAVELPPEPVIRFPPDTQVRSVAEWVDLVEQNEQNWSKASEFLYSGLLGNWLSHINELDLAREVEWIRRHVTDDYSIGLEQFQRIAGSFKPQRKSDALTNLDDLLGQLTYWKLREQRASRTLTLEITNRGRGYLHGVVVSKVAWIEVPQPRFGCLPRKMARVDIVVNPAKRRIWGFSLLPLVLLLK